MKKKSHWHSLGYWFDLDAIREPHKESSIKRISQVLNHQDGGEKQRLYIEENIIPAGGDLKQPAKILKRLKNQISEGKGKNPGDVWTIPTQPRPEAHFATFADALCIRPILASCPQEICRKCGKPRVRIAKTNYRKHRPSGGEYTRSEAGEKRAQTGNWGTMANNLIAEHFTTGWTDCGCNVGFEPGVALDPFAGRGTALIMAKKLGRHFVGYELKSEYCEKLIRPSLEEIDPLFSRATGNTGR